ncbi:MAG: hypothetical protein ACRDYB_07100, partial [Acidimicrobiales bacterium]
MVVRSCTPHTLTANDAYTINERVRQQLQCAVLAHNLIRWTATIGQPGPVDQLCVARTIRWQLLAVPGRLVNRSGLPTLRGPARWPWRHLFTRRLDTIRALP